MGEKTTAQQAPMKKINLTLIKSAIENAGASSMREVSRLSGVPVQTLQQILSGQVKLPRLSTLKALAAFIGYDIDALYIQQKNDDSIIPDQTPIAERLRLLMNDTLTGERELAKITGLTQQAINKILNGHSTNPRTSTLAPIANYFNVSIPVLRGEVPIPQERPKGMINPEAINQQPIPLLSWQHLPLLPDALQNRSRTILTKHYDCKSAYATTLPYSKDIAIVDFDGRLKHSCHAIILTTNGIVIGDIFVRNTHVMLIPHQHSLTQFRLEPGQYRKLGIVLEIIKN